MGIFELPDGYSEIKRVDLQKNKKVAVIVNVMAFIIAALMFLIGYIIIPFSFDNLIDDANINTLLISMLKLLGILAAMIAYLFGHELIHGIFFKKYSGKKAKYGFTGLYAYAACDAYFNKRQYLIIGLSPVVFFGIVFLLLNILLPPGWFWMIYFLQIINISGAAGDCYIAYILNKIPSDVLIYDIGVGMIFYSKNKL